MEYWIDVDKSNNRFLLILLAHVYVRLRERRWFAATVCLSVCLSVLFVMLAVPFGVVLLWTSVISPYVCLSAHN